MKVHDLLRQGQDLVTTFRHTKTGQMLTKNWNELPEGVDQSPWAFVHMRPTGSEEEGKPYDVHRPTETLYKHEDARIQALRCAVLFFGGARYYLAAHLVGDMVSYGARFTKEEKPSFNPKGLIDSHEGRRFLARLTGFSLATSLWMPGAFEYAAVSFNPLYTRSILQLGVLTYWMLHPRIARVHLDAFENWEYPEAERLSPERIQQLSSWEVLKAFHEGKISLSNMIGMQALGKTKNYDFVSDTAVSDDDDTDDKKTQ